MGYNDFWWDINLDSKRIIIFCQSTQPSSQMSFDDTWDNVSVWQADVDKCVCQEEQDELHVKLHIKSTAQCIPHGCDDPFPILHIVASGQHDLKTVLSQFLGKTVISKDERDGSRSLAQKSVKAHSPVSEVSSLLTSLRKKISEPSEPMSTPASSVFVDSVFSHATGSPAKSRKASSVCSPQIVHYEERHDSSQSALRRSKRLESKSPLSSDQRVSGGKTQSVSRADVSGRESCRRSHSSQRQTPMSQLSGETDNLLSQSRGRPAAKKSAIQPGGERKNFVDDDKLKQESIDSLEDCGKDSEPPRTAQEAESSEASKTKNRKKARFSQTGNVLTQKGRRARNNSSSSTTSIIPISFASLDGEVSPIKFISPDPWTHNAGNDLYQVTPTECQKSNVEEDSDVETVCTDKNSDLSSLETTPKRNCQSVEHLDADGKLSEKSKEDDSISDCEIDEEDGIPLTKHLHLQPRQLFTGGTSKVTRESHGFDKGYPNERPVALEADAATGTSEASEEETPVLEDSQSQFQSEMNAEQPGVSLATAMKGFSSDLQKHARTREFQVQQLAFGALKLSNKRVNQLWTEDKKQWEQVVSEFKEQIDRELSSLEHEVADLSKVEKKSQAIHLEQLKLLCDKRKKLQKGVDTARRCYENFEAKSHQTHSHTLKVQRELESQMKQDMDRLKNKLLLDMVISLLF
ncbi:hypothetical protein ACOMHN_004061 [Nucella lapillus]